MFRIIFQLISKSTSEDFPPTASPTQKIKKMSLFDPNILEFVGDISVILNGFQSWFHSFMKIWVKLF